MHRTPSRTFLCFVVVFFGLCALRRGFKQTRVQGDPLQQGGALVFGPDGELRYQSQDRAGGEMLDVAALLQAMAAS